MWWASPFQVQMRVATLNKLFKSTKAVNQIHLSTTFKTFTTNTYNRANLINMAYQYKEVGQKDTLEYRGFFCKLF